MSSISFGLPRDQGLPGAAELAVLAGALQVEARSLALRRAARGGLMGGHGGPVPHLDPRFALALPAGVALGDAAADAAEQQLLAENARPELQEADAIYAEAVMQLVWLEQHKAVWSLQDVLHATEAATDAEQVAMAVARANGFMGAHIQFNAAAGPAVAIAEHAPGLPLTS